VARSLISYTQQREIQQADPKLRLFSIDVKCVTASGQDLPICGQVWLSVKIHGFFWKFPFLMSRQLCGFPIIGSDFLVKTQLVLDVARFRCHFAVFPRSFIKLVCSEHPKLQFQCYRW
jgi:hypothetical protein